MKSHIIRHFVGRDSAVLYCGRVMHDMRPGEESKPSEASGRCKKCVKAQTKAERRLAAGGTK